MVAANANFICYIVKLKLLRILTRAAGSSKFLISKVFSKPIVDIRFLAPDNDTLVALAEDGTLGIFQPVPGAPELQFRTVHLVHGLNGGPWTRTVCQLNSSLGALVVALGGSRFTVWRLADDLTEHVSNECPAEVVDCSIRNEQLALGCSDGAVRTYDLAQKNFPGPLWSPHNGEPLSGIAFVPNRPDLILTGTSHNRQLRLWRASPFAQNVTCLQTVTLLSESPRTDFFNHMKFNTFGEVLVLCNTNKSSGYILHLAEAHFDYVSEFSVSHPILSFALTNLRPHTAEQSARHLQLYCFQTKAVQLYSLALSACYNPAAEVRQPELDGPTCKLVFLFFSCFLIFLPISI